MNAYKTDSLPFFLAGLATGAALALLLSPRSGAATRRFIGRKVEEGKDLLRSRVQAAQDRIQALGSEPPERVNPSGSGSAGRVPDGSTAPADLAT
jgi:gas vesicle protein